MDENDEDAPFLDPSQKRTPRLKGGPGGTPKHQSRLARNAPPPSNRYLYALVLVSSIGGGLFGYDTGVVSGAIIEIKSKTMGIGPAPPGCDKPQATDPTFLHCQLTRGQIEQIVSITTLGAMVGAGTSGMMNQVRRQPATRHH
jgi:hypothetical protein